MRVIAGSAGRLRLLSVPGRKTRPTLDRVRESLFSILAPELPGARVLDLYAGTGALGIEALSRGAQWCVFAERDFAARRTIRLNLATTQLASRATVIAGQLPRDIARLQGDGPFDLVFADPPYSERDWPQIAVALTPLTRVGGTFVAQHDRTTLVAPVSGFSLRRQVDYGRTRLTLLRREAD